MVLVWTLVGTCLVLASTLATGLTTLHLRYRWDVLASSVRWLFWFFFLWVFVWSLMRSIFFLYISSLPSVEVIHDDDGDTKTFSQLDRLGIHGVLNLEESKELWITIVLCAGDLAMWGVALALFPLTYELWRLAKKSMDRGAKKEREMIGKYFTALTIGIAAFATVQTAFVATYGSYDVHTHSCMLAVYMVQFLGMAFMAALLLTLKVDGRKYETIHGTFVESPLYQRLRNIMLIYSTFSFVFQLSTLIVNVCHVSPDGAVLDVIGISLLTYNASGLALSVTTSCSQACVLTTCRHCLPENFEAAVMHQRIAAPKDEDLEAPSVNPVFVFTDIESSTALWNNDSELMTAATEIHDYILRSSLLKHRGYEITTVGDAFQVAFRTIGDAIEYCMDVQLQLLLAKWPRELDGAVDATKRQRVKGRVLFNGLRVRMGIHDASDDDGVLVRGVHVVTGKTTYSGVSEVIAEFLGDLGAGGQIVVSDRVASWLRHHHKELSLDVFMEHVGNYTVPQINAAVEVYQLQPSVLAGRAAFFPTPEKATLDAVARTRACERNRLARAVSLHRLRAESRLTNDTVSSLDEPCYIRIDV